MNSVKTMPAGTLPRPPADTGHVDTVASEASSSTLQEGATDNSPAFRERSSGLLSEERFINHPLFRGGRNVIPGMNKSEPWMRRNALELLSLCGIKRIAKAEPGMEFVVAALMNATLTEIRGLELQSPEYVKNPNECLLLVERRNSTVRFVDVDTDGLPDPQVRWFESLVKGVKEFGPEEGRFIQRSTFVNEIWNQYRHNEAAFKTFYQSISDLDLDPGSFSKLNAWVTVEDGRIEYVDIPGRFPVEKLDGLRTDFSSVIVEGAAHVSCTNRRILHGMPSIYMAYFNETFVRIRDVVRTAEDGIPHEEADDIDSNVIIRGVVHTEEDGVPYEEADDVDSNVILGAEAS